MIENRDPIVPASRRPDFRRLPVEGSGPRRRRISPALLSFIVFLLGFLAGRL